MDIAKFAKSSCKLKFTKPTLPNYSCKPKTAKQTLQIRIANYTYTINITKLKLLPNARLESFWDALWPGIRTFLCVINAPSPARRNAHSA